MKVNTPSGKTGQPERHVKGDRSDASKAQRSNHYQQLIVNQFEPNSHGALKETPLKQQVFEFSLQHGESWSLEEEEEERRHFASWLQKKAYFITGCTHKSGTRATIFEPFNNSGVMYSFELKEAQPQVKFSTWCGHMGKVNDFVIESMLVDTESKKIEGSGTNNKDEVLEVSGTLSKVSKWHGQYEQDGKTVVMHFDRFTIDEMTGKIEGNGDLKGDAFVIEDGQRRDNNLVSFRLDIQKKTSLTFEGTLNEAKNKIEGKQSTIGQISFEHNYQFNMSLKEFYNCEMRIDLKSKKEPRVQGTLKLNGTYHQESMTIKGDFQFDQVCDESIGKVYMDADKAREKFEIRGVHCTNRAQRLFFKKHVNGAKLFTMKKGDQVVQMACVELQIKENSTTGYNTLIFNMLDLDNNSEEQVTCMVPDSFKQQMHKDWYENNYSYRLPPYELAPFRVLDNLNLQTQILFYDRQKKRKTIIFLNGYRELNKDDEPIQEGQERKMLSPQWSSHPNENFIVVHPILAYKSCAPTDNELIFVNLVQNTPQKVVNIAPFKFVKFVETGLWPTRNLMKQKDSKRWETTVFMLVELAQKIYLMAYRCFAWPLHNSISRIKPLKADTIKLVNGCIDLNRLSERELGPADFTLEKIVRASLIKKLNVQGKGCQVVVVMQLVNQVVGFNLQNPKFFDTSATRGKVLTVPTQNGPSDQIYVALKEDQGSCTIYQVYQIEDSKLEYKEVYKSVKSSIVAFQVSISETGDLNTETPEHSIFVLEKDASYKCIKVTGSARDQYDFVIEHASQHFEQNEKVLNQLLNHPEKVTLIQCVLERDMISALTLDAKTLKSTVLHVNEKSNLKSKFEPLGYDNRRFEHKVSTKKEPDKEEHTQTVLIAEKVPWTQKNIFVVQEGKMSYFLIQQNLSSRKVDLMRLDTEQENNKHEGGKQLIIGNHYFAISLGGIGQFMLFKQYDLSFCCVVPFSSIEPLTLTEDGKQYILSQGHVLKVDKRGRFQTVNEKMMGRLGSFFRNCVLVMLDGQKDYKEFMNVGQYFFHPQDERLCGSFVFKRSKNDFISLESQVRDGQQKRTSTQLRVLMLNYETLEGGLAHNQDQQQMPGTDARSEIKSQLDEFLNHKLKDHSGFLLLIEYDSRAKFEKEKQRNQFKQILLTKDYMVVKIGNTVLFEKLTVILEKNLQAYKDIDIHHEHRLTTDEYMHYLVECLLAKEELQVEFQEVDLEGVDAHFIEDGIKIHHVAGHTSEEKVRNLIQISMNDVTVLWELDGNKEVSFLRHQHPLACSENFVNTGFTLFKYKDEDKFMQNTDFFTQNEDCSLVLSPKTKSHRQHFFRTFSGMNLLEVAALQFSLHISDDARTKYITYSTYLANFNNLTFFQIFREYPDFMELLVQLISKDKLKDQKADDEQVEVSDNILIRRLYWTLRMNLIEGLQDEAQKKVLRTFQANKTDNTQSARHNILHCLMLDKENRETIEALIMILKLSSEKRLSDLVGTFFCFKEALEIESDEVNTFISDAFLSSRICDDIETFEWYRDHKLLTFSSKNSLISKKTILKNFEAEQTSTLPFFTKAIKKYFKPPLKTTPVEVKLLEISWLGDNLPDFYQYLNNYDGEDLILNQFIKVLLESQYYSVQLMRRIALPYMAYILVSLVYFSVFLPYSVVPQHGFWGGPGEREQASLRVVVCFGALLISGAEVKQIIEQKKNYFKDFWNYSYWAANILSVFICIEQGTNAVGITRKSLIQLSSLEVVFQWGFAFYWVRLFPNLAFYVNMIQETLKDCAYFILILLAAFLMFGNAFYTLQGIPSVNSKGEQGQIWQDYFTIKFIDTAFANYMIGLGEFSYDTWATHPSGWMIWIYFITATFFTQIMFFNMLIAIMGSTFTRVTENREKASLIERVALYTDWYWAITFDRKLQQTPYLYVMKPKVDDKEQKEAAAAELTKLSLMREICERVSELQQRQDGVGTKIDKLETKIDKQDALNSQMNSKINSKINRLKMQMNRLEEKIIHLIEIQTTPRQ